MSFIAKLIKNLLKRDFVSEEHNSLEIIIEEVQILPEEGGYISLEKRLFTEEDLQQSFVFTPTSQSLLNGFIAMRQKKFFYEIISEDVSLHRITQSKKRTFDEIDS